MSSVAGKIHLKRSYHYLTENLTHLTPDFDTGNINFALSDLPDYLEFSNLFQMYRINLVKVSFTPDRVVPDISAIEASVIPQLWTVSDPTRDVPTTKPDFNSHPSVRKTILDHKVTRILKPAVLVNTSIDSNTMSRPQWKQWINTGNAGVKHSGLAYAFCWTNTSDTKLDENVRIDVTLYISLKGLK